MARRLTTIVATDIVGYSRLMGANEAGTLAIIKAHRKDIFKPLIDQHGGRVVKFLGDGALLEFSSVVDGVLFAIRAQLALAKENAPLRDENQVNYRIGINIGDVIADDDDIYGDGVNVAARLEGLAQPGGICISRTVRTHISGKIDLDLENLGEKEVKNIAEPVSAYRIDLNSKAVALARGHQIDQPIAGISLKKSIDPIKLALAAVLVMAFIAGGAWWWLQRSGPAPDTSEPVALTLPDMPSIAILPFDNLSEDQSQQYFVDGVVEDLITDLSKVPGLFVIARNSSFSYRGKSIDVAQVARELGVRHVLEGSVRRSGDQIRLNAQLIDGTTNAHVWADRYDGTLDDVFQLQDNITAKIIENLRIILSPAEQKTIASHGTQSPQAYDAFLRGMALLSERKTLDVEGNAAAVKEFEAALAADPEYANALAGIAWADWLYHTTINVYQDEKKYSAFANAEKSLLLADNAVAHRVLAKKHYAAPTHIVTSRAPHLAVAELEAALSIEPNNPDLLADLADVLPFAGQPEKAVEMVRKAIRLNPEHPKWYQRPLGIGLLLTGDIAGAEVELSKWLEDETIMVDYQLWLASALAQIGKIEEAGEALDYLRVHAGGALPTTEYALNRKWPLTGAAHDIFHRGLRRAGFPDRLKRSPVSSGEAE